MKNYFIHFLANLPVLFGGFISLFLFWNMFEFKGLVFLWVPSVIITIILWCDIQRYEKILTKLIKNNENK